MSRNGRELSALEIAFKNFESVYKLSQWALSTLVSTRDPGYSGLELLSRITVKMDLFGLTQN